MDGWSSDQFNFQFHASKSPIFSHWHLWCLMSLETIFWVQKLNLKYVLLFDALKQWSSVVWTWSFSCDWRWMSLIDSGRTTDLNTVCRRLSLKSSKIMWSLKQTPLLWKWSPLLKSWAFLCDTITAKRKTEKSIRVRVIQIFALNSATRQVTIYL